MDILTKKNRCKASFVQEEIKPDYSLLQSSVFQGEVIINYQLSILEPIGDRRANSANLSVERWGIPVILDRK